MSSIIPAHPGWWVGTIRTPVPGIEEDIDPRRAIETALLRRPVIAWAPVTVTLGSGGGIAQVLVPVTAGFAFADRRVPPEGLLILPPRGAKGDLGAALVAIWQGPRGERVEFAGEDALAAWIVAAIARRRGGAPAQGL